MNTRFLEALVWSARLQSFKAAATQLHLTQAAISGRIASLEEEFKQRLFERGSRTVRLTAAGHRLLELAERMLELDRVMHLAFSSGHVLHGRARVGVVESVVHTWLETFMQRVDAEHPELEMELTIEPTARLHELLARGSIDIALQTDPIAAEGVRNRVLGRLLMAWIVSSESTLPAQSTLRDLQNHAVITFTRGSHPHLAVLEAFSDEDLRPSKVHCVTSISAILRLVDTTRGVATLPLAAVEQLIALGRYRVLQACPSLPDLRLIASHRHDPVSPIGSTLVSLAADVMSRYASTSQAVIVDDDKALIQ